MADELNISDEVDDDEQGGAAVEEEEEEETGEEESEGAPPKPGSAAHRRARGDDVEEEEEEEEEEPPTAEELEEVAGGGKRTNTLKGRLAEVTRQRDEAIDASLKLVSKVAAGDGAAPTKKAEEPPPYDFKAKRREANKLLLEGDEEGAAAIQDEMDAKRQEIAEAQADQRAEAKVTATLEFRQAQDMAATIFEKLPYLNMEDKDNFNAEALEEFEMFRDGFLRKGETRAEAMRKAANKVALIHPELVEEEDDPPGGKKQKPGAKAKVADDDDDEQEEADPGKRSTNAQIIERLRKRTLKNARAENKQPPQIARAGTAHRDRLDVSKIDVEKLTDAQWDELPDDVKKQLRGDRLSA